MPSANKPIKQESSPKKVVTSARINPTDLILETINADLIQGLQDYSIKSLVEQSEPFGKKLVDGGLKTNQIRKFLDAVNLLKARLKKEQISNDLAYGELHLLRPKLAYAARQAKGDSPAEPLKKVLEAAIKKIRKEPEFFSEDFNRFAQLVESIIAYHKAAGGKNQ